MLLIVFTWFEVFLGPWKQMSSFSWWENPAKAGVRIEIMMAPKTAHQPSQVVYISRQRLGKQLVATDTYCLLSIGSGWGVGGPTRWMVLKKLKPIAFSFPIDLCPKGEEEEEWMPTSTKVFSEYWKTFNVFEHAWKGGDRSRSFCL